MSGPSEVAIVIPSKNYGKWLGQALESCHRQTVLPAEVIVCDGGSWDDSQDITSRWGATWLEEPLPGVGRWRNSGIAASSADWIISLDADDWLEPNYIERCLESRAMTVGVIAPGLKWEETDSIGWEDAPQEQMPDGPITLRRLLTANRLFVSSMFRRQAWEEVGGYDPVVLNEDWDLWIRILAAGWEVSVIAEPLLHHRAQPGALSSVASAEKQAIVRAWIRARHAELFALYG